MRPRVPGAFLLPLLLAGCGEPPAGPPGPRAQAPQVLRPVRVARASTSNGRPRRTFPGVARAGVESVLSFRVAGTVLGVAVKVGNRLASGQPIAHLDDRDYRLQLHEAEASLERARAESRNAMAIFERTRSLYEGGNASLSQLDAARAATESARAAVRSIEQRLALARSQLDSTRLAAPADCAVAAVKVEKNENVAAGQPVVLVTYGSRPEVQVGVPESLIAQIQSGRPAEVHFDAVPDRRFAAVVTEVGVSVAQGSATYTVRVRLLAEDAAIRPGMAAEVVLETGEDGGSKILVPPTAVGEDRQGRFVFVAAPGGGEGRARIQRRAVAVGELSAGGLEVTTGLGPGELVVTAGLGRIRDGLEVLLPADATRR